MAVKEGIDATNIDETGWGVIMAYSDDPIAQQQNDVIRDAVSELLRFRQTQARDRYREYTGTQGYRPGETKVTFLARNGVGFGPADPDRVPFYLLIIGDPTVIPYQFQEHLAIQYAVGRICFDTPEQYANYAQAVVAFETSTDRPLRRAAFFAPSNPDDRHSGLTASTLTQPLALASAANRSDWQIVAPIGQEATKERLGKLLGSDPQSFIFAAGHGMVFETYDARQVTHQGALLCADWPGPRQWQKPIPPDFYFSADDVGGAASAILMLAASYGNGTPAYNSARRQIAMLSTLQGQERAFAAQLPQRLLGHPQGDALAVIGLHERRFGHSTVPLPDLDGGRVATYASVIRRVLDGTPVGWALQVFSERYAELSSDLSTIIEEVRFGRTPDAPMLTALWIEANDMRSFSIFGDPAVRLPGEYSRGSIRSL